MARAKAWFVVLAPTILTLFIADAAWMLATDAVHPTAWAGALVGAAALPVQLAFFYVVPRVRSSRFMPLATAAGVVGVVLAASAITMRPVAFFEATLGLVAVLAYAHWSTHLPRPAAAKLAKGALLPSFTLAREDGSHVTNIDYRGTRALFLFYRGNWCPLCMAHIRDVAAKYRELEARGVKVVLVSPQPHAETRALAKKVDAPFDFLVDRGSAAARALGILHEGGLPAGFEALGYDHDTVLPTAILVDEHGRITFADQTDNYRVRPEPETFLRVLDGTDAESVESKAGVDAEERIAVV